jgi:hypothetical protein
MSETAALYILIFVGILFVLYVLGMIVHYERMLKLKDKQIESLQKDVNSAHHKLMTIDFEKFVEMNIRAEAEAMATWREVERTSEFSDVFIQEPTLEKVKTYGP